MKDMFKNINILKQMSLIFIFIALFTISPMAFAVDGLLQVQFYDENSLAILDGNVSIVDVTNNITYNPDANGYWDTNLNFLNWENKYINAYIERKVDGITTHTARNFQFYWNADQNYDLSFALLPVGLGEDIEFLVKDTNNELWDNKYVQFNTTLNNTNYNNWIQRTNSFSGDEIRSIAYGNGVWVAVGGSGKLATATDPTGTWTERTSSFSTQIYSIAYGNGVWVAVGDNGKLATATDPTGIWTQRTSGFGTTMISSVAYGNGHWVIVGDTGKLATATDPTSTWTLRTSGFGTSMIWKVYYNNGYWVIGGNDGKLATATDPTSTWTLRANPFGTTSIYAINYNNGYWIAGGVFGKLATATDPTGTWTLTTSSGVIFSTSAIWDIIYDGFQSIIIGQSGKLATATDPTGTWTLKTSSFSGSIIYKGVYNNEMLVLVGASGKLATLSHNFLNLKTSSSKTSSTGIFSDYLLTDGDYNAVLYDATGNEGDTYQKTTVNLLKPLDEKTEAEISPYDVQVGGLLNYTLQNQTSASVQFNVFAGLLNQYYNFRVVDYNATVSDQEYVPRNYVVAIPLGTSYQETYNLQPYLLKKEDAIVPKIYTIDILGNSIDGVQILITKNIDGVQTLVESGETIAGGTMSFTAYPLDTYQILAYYQGELKAQGTIVPRTSADVYTITIDILPDKPLQDYFNFGVNWKTTKSRFNIVDENINILFRASVNLALVDDYTVTLEKAGVVVGTATVPYAGFNTDANVTFNKNLFTTADISSPIIIRVKANLSDGSTISRTKQVYLSGGGLDPITSFQKVPEELGQPLAIIIAFLVVGFLIGFLMMSGFVRDPVKIGYFGIFLLAPFVMLGFFDMGVTVLGVDIGKFFYSLAVIVTLYLAMRELR